MARTKTFKGPTRKGARLAMQLIMVVVMVAAGQFFYDANAPAGSTQEQHRRVGRSLLDTDEEDDTGEGSGEAVVVDTWPAEGRLNYPQVLAKKESECVTSDGTWQDYGVKGEKGGCTPHPNASLVNASAGKCDHWVAELSSYPDTFAVFNCDQMTKYGWVPLCIGVIYTFWALAIICDDFFVPSLDVIEERFNVKPDIAGATLMAAGGSAPELAMSFIGTFLTRSNVGFAAIVGSAVFNVLFVIGCCAMFSSGELKLTAWPLFRDSMWYMVCLATLVICFGVNSPDFITLGEGLVMFSLYIFYVIICMYSETLREKAATCFSVFEIAAATDETEMDDLSKEDKSAAEKADRKYKKNLHRMGSIFTGTNKKLEKYRRTSATHLFVDIAAAHAAEGGVSALISEISQSSCVTKQEFSDFLKAHKMTDEMNEGEINELFDSMDTNKDGTIRKDEFATWFGEDKEVQTRLVLQARSEFAEFEEVEEDVLSKVKKLRIEAFLDHTNRQYLRKRMSLIKFDSGESTIEEFQDWFASEMRTAWKEDMKSKPKKKVTVSATADDDGEDGHIEWPNTDTGLGIVASIVAAPMMILFLLTIPDVRNTDSTSRHWFLGGCITNEDNFWPVAFFMSITWIIVYSYAMVWWTTVVGLSWGIPSEVMALTFLAAGTSIPDLLTSVAVARKGHGDMAVSSSIGSNIFDVAFGLPVPWFIYAAIYEPVGVGSDSLFLSVGLLLAMLAVVVILIIAFKWVMTKGLGVFMFLLYGVFIAQDLARRPNL